MGAPKTTKSILSAGELIRQVLTADKGVRVITTKVFPVATNEAVLPYVLYRRSSMEQQPQKHRGQPADAALIEVLCFATKYGESVQLAEAVRRALDGKQIAGEGITLRSCYLTDSEEAWQDDAFVQQLLFTIKI